jgi:glycerate kinase
VKIILAPDKFKQTLSTIEFCKAASLGIRRCDPEARIISMPLSDGGEGLCLVFENHGQFAWRAAIVRDPLFRTIDVHYLYDPDQCVAVIGLSTASGLNLLNEDERNPLKTTSFGFGELILKAVQQGARHIILGLGGSATNDAGIGMAAALGYRFLDSDGHVLTPVGGNLINIADIKKPDINLLKDIKITVLSDVTNQLFGPEGAAMVYSGQKGADERTQSFLDRSLRHFAAIVKEKLDLEIAEISGAGAAGGLGAGCKVFLNAMPLQGASFILDFLDFESQCRDADLVITGEGSFDPQSDYGKTPAMVADRATILNIPVALIAGQIQGESQKEALFKYKYDISKHAGSKEKAMQQTASYVEKAAYEIVYQLKKDHGQITGT